MGFECFNKNIFPVFVASLVYDLVKLEKGADFFVAKQRRCHLASTLRKIQRCITQHCQHATSTPVPHPFDDTAIYVHT